MSDMKHEFFGDWREKAEVEIVEIRTKFNECYNEMFIVAIINYFKYTWRYKEKKSRVLSTKKENLKMLYWTTITHNRKVDIPGSKTSQKDRLTTCILSVYNVALTKHFYANNPHQWAFLW